MSDNRQAREADSLVFTATAVGENEDAHILVASAMFAARKRHCDAAEQLIGVQANGMDPR